MAIKTIHVNLRSRSGMCLIALALTCSLTSGVHAQGAYTDLHDFGGTIVDSGGATTPDGITPYAGVTFDSAGNMYGTASGDGDAQDGIVWEITAAGEYKILHNFGGNVLHAEGGDTGPDGTHPYGGVAFDTDGNMYGTTSAGGMRGTPYYGGVIWELSAGGQYEVLHDFGGTITRVDGSRGQDGGFPTAGVAVDSDRNLYGTTYYGGANGGAYGDGIVWELKAGGAYRDLHDFGGMVTNANGKTGPDGVEPYAGVTLDSAGDLFGTASGGGGAQVTFEGLPAGGIVWKIASDGAYKDLHDFGGLETTPSGTLPQPYEPEGGVTFDTAGDAYGTTMRGGVADDGSAWELPASGGYLDLHDFAGGTSGADPAGSVTLDALGNLYGAASAGGAANGGSVWRITRDGAYEDLHIFGGRTVNSDRITGPDGSLPQAAVAIDNAGNIFGTCLAGGAYGNAGIVWKLAGIAASGTSPAAPADLTATAGNAEVSLTWSVSATATSYNLYRSTSSTATKALYRSSITGTSYVDNGVSNGVKYYYQLEAVNAVGTSPLSHGVSATPEIPAPAPPTNLDAVGRFCEVFMTWTPSEYATSYDIYRSTSSTGPKALYKSGITGSVYIDGGVTNGVKYYYQLAAVNSSGTSELSHGSSATPHP